MKRTLQAILRHPRTSHGFALATVLIASTVMLTVLVTAVTSTAAVRVSLQTQYYNELSRTAAESGVAYAKACLNANNGIPKWSASAPLMVNTDCSGVVQTNCLASSVDPACAVAVNSNVTSEFSVAYPTTDSSTGKATNIPSTGIVNILRTSSVGTDAIPWRTYKQTTFLSLVPVSQCSPNNPATLGWTNAVIASAPTAVGGPAIITLATGNLNPGPIFYRKDFMITQAGAYVLTASADDHSEVSIDGQVVLTTPDHNGTSITLTAGCHTASAKAMNYGMNPSASNFRFELIQVGPGTDAMVSDTSWRVTTGSTVHFSSPNYYQDPNSWALDRDFGVYSNTSLPWGGAPSTWATVSGDSNSHYISTVNSQSGTNYPGSSYTWLRNPTGFTLTSPTQVKVSAYCDDVCDVYLDGNLVYTSDSAHGSAFLSTTITIQPGQHTFGIRLYNASNANVGAALFAAVRVSDGSVLMRSDASWYTALFWTTTPNDYFSYDASFVPSTLP